MTATRLFLTAAAVISSAAAFNTIQPRMIATRTQTNNKSSVASFMSSNNNNNEHENHFTSKPIVSTLTALSIFATLSTTPLLLPNTNNANAYEESDYASETVTTVVQRLKSSTGSIDDTFLALEDVAKIITEGKGVGGQLTYDGVKLNEGYVADEDTTIYNPGLSLLTESEKERLTDAIIQNRKVSLSSNQWNENNEYAFSFLKQKLDPLHMYELGGYLKILPFWGAALYLGALFVQQNSRGIFPLVYGLCALGVFGPVIVLVASGP
mmetsp:Transcript_596/g.962  ORF Transcript_596/g.962 Transcript_596/m.962 type:complete len:267 (+) Transcript_596:130-930(+)|eukprot:scaffold19507_cov120-Skeletonema_dohrnii-CCMP3373.AAC.3